MKEGQSFAEYVGVVEATLGAKADPDRAYEAFTAGVSPEVFVKSVVRNSVKEVPSNLRLSQSADRSRLVPLARAFGRLIKTLHLGRDLSQYSLSPLALSCFLAYGFLSRRQR